jgi:hypothetical protein
MGVGVAWWHPEEMPWLSRSRSIMPLPTMTISKFFGVGVAWWFPEEIPWPSRSIMPPFHINDNSKKWCGGDMVAPWRHTLAKSKLKHNVPYPHWEFQKNGCRGGMVAPWRNTSAKSKQKHKAPFPQWQFRKNCGVRGGTLKKYLG